MRREQQTTRQEQEFDGKKLNEYQSGTDIVVNVKGDWVVARLVEDATIEHDTLKIKVASSDTRHPMRGRTLMVSEAPHIVQFSQGKTLRDPKVGTFEITSAPRTTRRGTLEYQVTDTSSGEVTEGVSEELLQVWQKNVELEGEFEKLEAQVSGMADKYQKEISDKITSIQKVIKEAYAVLPDVEKMGTYGYNDIKKIETKIAQLQERATTLVKEFEAEISRIKGASAKESQATTKQKSERAKKRARAEHVRSDAEKDADEKRKEEYKKYVEELKTDIAAEVQRRSKDIREKMDERIADLKQQEQAARDKYKKDIASWNKQNKKTRGKKPTQPDYSVYVLPKDEKKQFEDNIKEIENLVLLDALTNQRTRQDSELHKRIKEQMAKLAKKDRFADANDLDKNASHEIIGYVDPILSGKMKKYEDIFNTYYFQKQKEAFDIVTKAWEEKRDIDSVDTPEEEKYDFKADIDDMQARVDALIADIPDYDDGTIKDTADTLKENIDSAYKKLLSLNVAIKEKQIIPNSSDSSDVQQQKLQNKRIKVIKKLEHSVDTLQADIDALKRKHNADALKKDVKEFTPDTIETSEAPEVIDIPEYLMRELLSQRQPQVREAVKQLLEANKDADSNTFKTDALDAFKAIFDTAQPGSQDVADIMNKLRDAGIKDWADFKKLWDSKLAEQSMHAMDHLATAVVRRNITENITWRDKLNKQVGQVLSRAALSLALVGGTAAGVTLLTGGAGLLGAGAAIAGGAAGGGMRGWLNKKIFGNEKMKARQQRLQQELEDSKRAEVIDGMIDQIMHGIVDNDPVGTSVAKSRNSSVSLEGLPSFAGILAQTVRDISSEMVKLHGAEPEEAQQLQGNARVLYERALSQLETRNPDAEMKKKLAIAISEMNGSGDKKFADVAVQTDPKIMGLLEKTVATYSGKNGIAGSAVMGGIVGGAFFANSEIARATLGGLFGAVKGYESGKAADVRVEQQAARRRVYGTMNYLRGVTEDVLRGQQHFDAFSPERKNELRSRLVELKKLLHVNVSNREDLAIFGIVARNEDGDFVDVSGNVIVSSSGEIVSAEVRALMQDMRSAVTDAERAGMIFEQEGDKQRLDKVLEAMKDRTKSIEDTTPATRRSWWARNKQKVLRTAGGAVAGAVSALLLGKMTSMSRDYIKEDMLGMRESGISHHMANLEHELKNTVADIEHQQRLDAMQQEDTEAVRQERADIEDVSTPIETTTPEIKTPEQVGDTYTVPKRGGSFLRGAQALDNNLSAEHIQAIRNAHPEWEKLSEKRMLAQWRVEQAKENGQWFDSKAQYFNTRIHPGAEMKLMINSEGYPVIQLGDEHVEDLKGTLVKEKVDVAIPADVERFTNERELIEKSGIMDDMVDAGKVSDADIEDFHKATEFYAAKNPTLEEFREGVRRTMGLDESTPSHPANALLEETQSKVAAAQLEQMLNEDLGIQDTAGTVTRSRMVEQFGPTREVVADATVDTSAAQNAVANSTNTEALGGAVAGSQDLGNALQGDTAAAVGGSLESTTTAGRDTSSTMDDPEARRAGAGAEVAPPTPSDAFVLPSAEAYQAMPIDMKFEHVMSYMTNQWSDRLQGMHFDNVQIKANIFADLNDILAHKDYNPDFQSLLDTSTPEEALQALQGKLLESTDDLSADMRVLLTEPQGTGEFFATADAFGGPPTGILRYMVNGQDYVIYKPDTYFMVEDGHLYLGGDADMVAKALGVDKNMVGTGSGESAAAVKVVPKAGGGYDVAFDSARI